MLHNTKRNVVTTAHPQITTANYSEYQRALFFIRLGAIDICQQAPYHSDYDQWRYNDQLNYESGRIDTGNLLSASPLEQRAQLAQQIVQAWPETVQKVPEQIAQALGRVNQMIGSAFPKTIQPPDADVKAAVTRDVRGRISFKIPTVSNE